MGDLSDAVRPFWTPGLHRINGIPNQLFHDWIAGGEYQVYAPIAVDGFEITVSDNTTLLKAIAADCNRFASAALESVISITDSSRQTKATAWILIRAYYAAYYAANALLRIFGQSTSQLEYEHVGKVFEIAQLYGYALVPAITTGYYNCAVSPANSTLTCKKMSVRMGAHEAFWCIFTAKITDICTELLATNTLSTNQKVAGKLDDLLANLRFGGRNAGNWLAAVRNKVTYRHGMGVWFPYHNGIERSDVLRVIAKWETDPLNIQLKPFGSNDVGRFVATCAFILATMHEVLLDLKRRHVGNRSFLDFGPNAYMNLANV